MNKSIRMKRLSIVSAVVATSAMLLSTLPAQAAQTTGVTASEIKLGISSPTSGSAGLVYGKVPGAMKAYFDYINANGGVYGRKIKLVSKNDKYTVKGAATSTFDLVYKDNVFVSSNLNRPPETVTIENYKFYKDYKSKNSENMNTTDPLNNSIPAKSNGAVDIPNLFEKK